MRNKLYPAAGLALVALAACAQEDAAPKGAGLANPAAVFCTEQGGTLKIVTEKAGERGICVLPDGTERDSWEYFREHHAEGTPANGG